MNGALQPVWVSENMKQVLGYDAAEALVPSWWIEAVHADDVKQLPDRTGSVGFEEGMREAIQVLDGRIGRHFVGYRGFGVGRGLPGHIA